MKNMSKADYLSLVNDATNETELVGIRNAANADFQLSMSDVAEIDRAVGIKANRIRMEGRV